MLAPLAMRLTVKEDERDFVLSQMLERRRVEPVLQKVRTAQHGFAPLAIAPDLGTRL
jgi:hypothetical protein